MSELKNKIKDTKTTTKITTKTTKSKTSKTSKKDTAIKSNISLVNIYVPAKVGNWYILRLKDQEYTSQKALNEEYGDKFKKFIAISESKGIEESVPELVHTFGIVEIPQHMILQKDRLLFKLHIPKDERKIKITEEEDGWKLHDKLNKITYAFDTQENAIDYASNNFKNYHVKVVPILKTNTSKFIICNGGITKAKGKVDQNSTMEIALKSLEALKDVQLVRDDYPQPIPRKRFWFYIAMGISVPIIIAIGVIVMAFK